MSMRPGPHSFQVDPGESSLFRDPLPEPRRMNESRMLMGSSSNSFQNNVPATMEKPKGVEFKPAVDAYSHHNRLCELFPTIPPPRLQRVFDECGRDFLRTIDNVLYDRRLRRSILAQLRSQRQNQQANSAPNIQKQKEHETSSCSQAQESQQQKPEKRCQQSPKSSASSETAANTHAKRSRIVAYEPSPTSSVHSSRKGGISSPKCNQATQGPRISTPQSIRKPSSPNPNVFLHQIDMGHPMSGGVDTSQTRKTNQGHMFSFRNPMINTSGTLPHPSRHFSMPSSTCVDSNAFCPPCPPPPPPSIAFSSPQQLPFVDWCPKDPIQYDPQLYFTTPPQQVGQIPQQDIVRDERMGWGLQSADEVNLTSDRNLEMAHQSSEADPLEWPLLLESIMDPFQAVDSNFNLEDYVLKSPEGNSDDAQEAQTRSSLLRAKESGGSVNESVSVETDINRKGESQMESCSEDEEMKTTPPYIMSGSRKSLANGKESTRPLHREKH